MKEKNFYERLDISIELFFLGQTLLPGLSPKFVSIRIHNPLVSYQCPSDYFAMCSLTIEMN